MAFSIHNSTPPEAQKGGTPNSSAPAHPTVARVIMPSNRAKVTYAILGITVLMYLLQNASVYITPGRYDYPAMFGMKINELIFSGEIWRLLTPVLLHGSIPHILFNMYALYAFGTGLERYYGHWRFLILYIIGGLAGNVGSFLFSEKPSLGASTAIFALVAAEAIFIYRNRFFFGKKAGSMLVNTIFIVIINLILGLSPGIDNWGHLGGLMGGLAYAWFAGPVFKLDHSPTGLVISDRNIKTMLKQVTIIIVLFISMFALLKFLFPGL